MSRIVITGANRGMGLGAAKLLIEQGHEVWGTARNPDSADELRALGPAGIVPLDLADRSSIESAAAELSSSFDSLDILVNNSGTTERALGADMGDIGPMEIDPDLFLQMIDINCVGPILFTRALRPLLGNAERPLVFSQSSQLASPVIGKAIPYTTGYNASKASLNMWHVMAAVRDPEVIYVTYHPGYVQTDMSGPNAEVPVDEASENFVRNILSVGPDDTGRFLRPDGTDHPW